LPLIEQPVTIGSTIHAMPAPPGSASAMLTPFAVPGPALVTPIVNSIGSPAFTLAEPAVFVMETVGQLTVVDADAVALPGKLLPNTVAVFAYAPQLSNFVPLDTRIVAPALAGRSPKLHASV
jgi:hypothetical protein